MTGSTTSNEWTPNELDIHPATADEIVAAHRNVHPDWARGRTLDEHVKYRLTSPSHTRATWFVGCARGKVVVSLGRYPLQFQVSGEVLRGCAIGSVFTLPGFRKRGFAGRLLEWVDRRGSDEGMSMSILYSDIDPNFYARLGYTACPSSEGWCNPLTANVVQRDIPLRLVEFDAGEELSEMALMYGEYHGALPISIVRDEGHWDSILKKFPDDRYYWLQDAQGARAGYARIQRQDATARITDYALANHADELAAALYEAVILAARGWGVEKLGGWLADEPVSRSYFAVSNRAKEITMIKPLARASELLSAETLNSIGRFCEIDHV